MSIISLEGMEFFAHHGCFVEEQIIGTKFIVDFYYESDTEEAEITDDLDMTINYQMVYQIIKKEMQEKSRLLEHLARRILDSICNRYPEISDAEIKISKINPPIGGQVEKVCIILGLQDLNQISL